MDVASSVYVTGGLLEGGVILHLNLMCVLSQTFPLGSVWERGGKDEGMGTELC